MRLSISLHIMHTLKRLRKFGIQSNTHKYSNLQEMEKFLENHTRTQIEIDDLNSWIILSKFLVKNLPQNISSQYAFTGKLCQKFKNK